MDPRGVVFARGATVEQHSTNSGWQMPLPSCMRIPEDPRCRHGQAPTSVGWVCRMVGEQLKWQTTQRLPQREMMHGLTSTPKEHPRTDCTRSSSRRRSDIIVVLLIVIGVQTVVCK